jgi:hypothetical protein
MSFGKPGLRDRFLRFGAGLSVSALAFAPVAAAPHLAAASSASNHRPATAATTTETNWYITQYGWVDNSPPGPDIAYTGCTTPGGEQVTSDDYAVPGGTDGGNGSYDEPIVMAWYTDQSSFCQIGYVPALQKYYIHADICDPCSSPKDTHWDLWIGGSSVNDSGKDKKALLQCEDTWTFNSTTVILSPPTDEPVDTSPLFTPPSTCATSIISSS